MFTVGDSKSDTFFRSLYSNKLTWYSLQFILGVIPSIYLIQNPIRIITGAIASAVSNPISITTLSNIFQILFLSLHGITFFFLIFFHLHLSF
jgi:predicted AAA+ superfamily ATPase